ncbi:MAG: hypothetical protein JWO86_2325 [Myxococcaceae bacterium]|nr:hypothetical protein [Myxococcaceae bacterium]
MASLAKILPGGGGAPYVVDAVSSQYLLYHALGAVLTRVVGDALLANQLLLAVVAVVWPLSLRSALRALGRDDRLAIFGSMVFFNRALAVGFLPFIASIPLLLFAMAALVRQLAAPTRRRAVGLGLLGLTLFYTHVSAFLLFVLTAGVMVGMRLLRSNDRRAVLLATAAPLVPSAIAAAVWWRAGSLEGPTGHLERVNRLPLAVMLDAAPIWTFDVWASHGDELCAVIWWAAFGVIIAFRGDTKDPPVSRLLPLVPVACAAAAYLLTPFSVGAAGYLNLRLAPILTMFAILALRPRRGLLGDVPLAAAAVVAIGMSAVAAFEMRRMEREQLGDIDALLAHARPGTRLATLNFQTRSPRANFWPYVFAGSYHRAYGGAIASYSFTELAHWPLHYAPGSEPPTPAPFWVYSPCSFRYRTDGSFYDYVLVQGRLDPFAAATPGPVFRRVAHEGAFTLYEKTSAAADDTTPDKGPCPVRPGPGDAAPRP